MTDKDRAAVVVKLRCAADQKSLAVAGVWPAPSQRLNWMAWEAKRAVQADRARSGRVPHDDEAYRELLLEAAARVEEGSWP